MTNQTSEYDLTGELDATEQMVENQKKASEQVSDQSNERMAGHNGSMKTEPFDIGDAIDRV